MTLEELRAILEDCKFPTMDLRTAKREEGLFMWVCWHNVEGVRMTSRKWIISAYATKSEVVQTLLKAILTAIEHEAREQFTYKDRAIFGPHFDIEALVGLVNSKKEDRRL